eukprot:1517420-Ditylum_brightwellii.AAC.1
MAVDVCIRVRSMNSHIQEMEEWWCLEIFDGVRSHLNSLTSMRMRRRHQILLVKEEGDSLHVNQAYDHFVAKADKRAKNESLSMLRNARFLNKG